MCLVSFWVVKWQDRRQKVMRWIIMPSQARHCHTCMPKIQINLIKMWHTSIKLFSQLTTKLVIQIGIPVTSWLLFTALKLKLILIRQWQRKVFKTIKSSKESIEKAHNTPLCLRIMIECQKIEYWRTNFDTQCMFCVPVPTTYIHLS